MAAEMVHIVPGEAQAKDGSAATPEQVCNFPSWLADVARRGEGRITEEEKQEIFKAISKMRTSQLLLLLNVMINQGFPSDLIDCICFGIAMRASQDDDLLQSLKAVAKTKKPELKAVFKSIFAKLGFGTHGSEGQNNDRQLQEAQVSSRGITIAEIPPVPENDTSQRLSSLRLPKMPAAQ